MHDWQSLAHVRWECKYHVVIPRFRKKMLYGQLRRRVGRIYGSCVSIGAWSRPKGSDGGSCAPGGAFRT